MYFRKIGQRSLKLLLVHFLFLGLLFAQERVLYEHDFNTQTTGLFLPVEIDGKECKFLFDTGASFVVLDRSFRHLLSTPLTAKQVQARTGLNVGGDSIITPNGEIKLEMFKAVSLRLGRLQVKNRYPYILADLQSLWRFSGEKFCGILGTSFLHQFRWEIDFDKGKVRAYFGDEPYMGSFTSRAPIFWSAARIPQVHVAFQGQNIVFDIDIGDNGSGRIIKQNVKYLKRAGLVTKTHKQKVVTVSSLSNSEEFRLKNFRFANVLYPDIVMQTSKQNAIGLAFFRRHNVVFDFPFNMLYLEHHQDYAAFQELDKSGIRVILEDGKLIVFSMKHLKRAVVKGIRVGDEILTANGKKISLFHMRKLLRQKRGTRIFLEMQRKDGVHKGSIVLGKDPLS